MVGRYVKEEVWVEVLAQETNKEKELVRGPTLRILGIEDEL